MSVRVTKVNTGSIGTAQQYEGNMVLVLWDGSDLPAWENAKYIRCAHMNYHTVSSVYDRIERVIHYVHHCDDCGTELLRQVGPDYEPNFKADPDA